MNIYCVNCGKNGHNYSTCKSPIISLGVILVRYDKKTNVLKYLMVCRKDTIGFIEFMRGKYSTKHLKYLKTIVSIMTHEERQKIKNNDFDTLWNQLWLKKNNKQNVNEYEISKEKFNIIKTKLIFDSIDKSLEHSYDTPEWGFPKGRRELYEKDLECAKREFQEETGLKEHMYSIINNVRVHETFNGSNNLHYKHIYYLGKVNKHGIDTLNNSSFNSSEISRVEWKTFEEAINCIRPYNIEKKKLITGVNKRMQLYYKNKI